MAGKTPLRFHRTLSLGVALAALLASPSVVAQARDTQYGIKPQPLDAALRDFGTQSGLTIMADAALTRGRASPGYSATSDPDTALRALLGGTGLTFRRDGVVFVVVRAVPDPNAQSGAKAGAANRGGDADGKDIVVTAQRREEQLQDVPLAVTAISGRKLQDQKIETGAELLRAVPNVNFSKSNFSSFNFTIRGIGTKAIAASVDPAVAISFNSTPLIRSRLFEQEFFDIQRVEVLRGPQGTLYGRNATGGVVNILPALPTNKFDAAAWVEAGNFKSLRSQLMINVPITDTLAIRAAGAFTKRDGFDYNTFTDKQVNGRKLYSTRVTAQWRPDENFNASFIWQHFNEDDDRARTGKALCTRDPGPSQVGGVATSEYIAARLSQGCLPGSLYDEAAYGLPNGGSLAQFFAARLIGYGGRFGSDGSYTSVDALRPAVDPYAGQKQSRNLREVATSYDPRFRATNDVYQLNLDGALGDSLRIYSQTLYTNDRYYSTQDYNRFVSNPIFSNSSDPTLVDVLGRPFTGPGPTPGGVFTDPQLGASDRSLSVDISKARTRQWSQEFRLQSKFDGPFNFSLGANWLDFRSLDEYYVFNNVFTLVGQYLYNADTQAYFGANGAPSITTRPCQPTGVADASQDCVYIDPNPLSNLNGQGHNYFLSRNIVKTRSAALFGEAYFNLTDNLKLTAGLRYTDDRKVATPVPSQLLLGIGPNTGLVTGGQAAIGYPALPDIVQSWRRFSGRLVVDWKPDLSFTDETLVYGSFAHGYKGGGANPPRVDINPEVVQFQPLPETFRPEYVNAFEIGTKNQFADGKLTLNVTAFYYKYTDYQISQIVDRIALNENFNATSYGLELETAFRPAPNLQIDANVGYLRTRLGKGARSIDVMDRTQGNPDWMVVRPNIQVPSNCIAPADLVQAVVASGFDDSLKALGLQALCNGSQRYGSFTSAVPNAIPYNLLFNTREYNPLTDAPNGGRGFYADLEGKELPNSPHLTINVGVQYTLPIGDWGLTARVDYYRQSASYARIYNTTYDRLRAWDNLNLSLTLAQPTDKVALQLYVKNVFNDAPITDVFTNSDDTGLTGNVFVLDPRIIGLRLSKSF